MIEKIDKEDFERLKFDLEEAYNQLNIFFTDEVRNSNAAALVELNYDKLKSLSNKVKICANDLSKIRKYK